MQPAISSLDQHQELQHEICQASQAQASQQLIPTISSDSTRPTTTSPPAIEDPTPVTPPRKISRREPPTPISVPRSASAHSLSLQKSRSSLDFRLPISSQPSFATSSSSSAAQIKARPQSAIESPVLSTTAFNNDQSRSPHGRHVSADSSLARAASRSQGERSGARQAGETSKSTGRTRHHTLPMSNRLKPSMTLEFDGVQRKISNESVTSDISDKPLKSPGVFGSFFGWKGNSPQSPTTTFSERSLSPAPSPAQSRPDKPLPFVPGGRARLAPSGLDIQRANTGNNKLMAAPETPMHAPAMDMSAHVNELERELAHIGAELAGSIRREMDLEDELDRMKMDHSVAPSELSRRGSDYFSDSGAGSVRYPISDPDAKIQEEERLRRKAEQDRAQIKLDMAARVQVELSKRRDLEERLQAFEHEGGERNSKRVEELEAQLAENTRRLNQEKEARANFEDLYTALQQELSAGRRQIGTGRGFGSIAEEGDGYSPGLSRSGSLARSGSKRAGSLNRSGSVKGRQRSGSGSAPVTAEGMQEVEDQRDALHKALKLLISRFDKQQKEHERHVKKLTKQKRAADKLVITPGKSTYHRDVSVLKEEVTTLRRRTEDALEQKWQYEKSLGGIKMDLDRAEHETRGLRDLLAKHDILAPSPRTLQSATFGGYDAAAPILSAAEKDREQARRLAEQFRQQAASMQKSGSNQSAVNEIQKAAARMDQLHQQFDTQIKTNTALHHRLSAAVEKGEREQEQSTRQIQDMQKKLAGMEDSLLAAQQHSENTLNKHESQVRSIEESTSPRLQRFTLEVSDADKLAPGSPSAMRRSTLGGIKKKVQDQSLLDASRTSMLERKVRELERMLRDAEDDMQNVVQRVNRSQLEVAELTNERDAAFTQMRKLQKQLVSETERAEDLIGGRARPAKPYDSGSDYSD